MDLGEARMFGAGRGSGCCIFLEGTATCFLTSFSAESRQYKDVF